MIFYRLAILFLSICFLSHHHQVTEERSFERAELEILHLKESENKYTAPQSVEEDNSFSFFPVTKISFHNFSEQRVIFDRFIYYEQLLI